MWMSYPSATPVAATQTIPPRVQAAMQFVQMMNTKEMGVPSFDGSRTPSGSLTPKERAAYDSAMLMLQQYFSGEMDFGDTPPSRPQQHDGQDPKSPLPVG